MQHSSGVELLARVVAAEPIAAAVCAIEARRWPVTFSHVVEQAQPLLIAAVAKKIRQTLWIICPTVRSQEQLYESLLNWSPGALFLPETEFAALKTFS